MKAGTWVDLERLEKIRGDEEFREVFQGSPLKRPKLSGLLRNAQVVLDNHTVLHDSLKARQTVETKRIVGKLKAEL